MDLLYFCLVCTLLLDRFSLVRPGFGGKIFIYQAISFGLVFFSFAMHDSIYIPCRIITAYLPVFIQSCLVVIIGRAGLGIILKENIQLIFLLAMTVVVYNYAKTKTPRFLQFISMSYHFWIISALILAALYLSHGIRLGINIDGYFPYPRLKGLSGDPNVFGIYILTFLPFVLYQNKDKRNRKIFILIFTTATIFMTFSRTNILVLLLFFPIYIALGLASGKISRKEVLFILLMLLILSSVILTSVPVRQAVILRFTQFVNDTSVNSNSRFGLWVKGLNLYRRYPVMGIGMDHSTVHLHYFIHNTFIEWIVSCGIFSLCVLGLYARYFFLHLIRCKKNEMDFYYCLAYLLHILTLSCVSLLNFEPTFIIFSLSEAYLSREQEAGGYQPRIKWDAGTTVRQPVLLNNPD